MTPTRQPSLLAQATAEFLGTCALITLGPGAAAVTANDPSLPRLLFVAGVFALVVAGAIVAIGRVSGAHINPAVTVALAVRDRSWERQKTVFVAAQVAGALTGGALLLLALRPDDSTGHLGSTALSQGISPAVGFALEVAGTFGLAFCALHASRLAASRPARAAVVGATLFALIVALGPLTGASFNPARSIGPAVASTFLDNLGLYIAGPLAGGALAGALALKPKDLI